MTQQSDKTSGKHPNLTGGGFKKHPQPAPSKKSAGWARKKKNQELARAILELKFVGPKGSEIRRLASEYFNMPEDKITVEMMMFFRQAEKAIQKADTSAFVAYMDRAHGKAAQPITGEDGKDLFPDKSNDELKELLRTTMEKLNDQ